MNAVVTRLSNNEQGRDKVVYNEQGYDRVVHKVVTRLSNNEQDG